MKINIQKWILPSQMGYILGRYIFYNVFMVNQAMDYVLDTKQSLVIIFLDFNKAYDRLSWSFLKATMIQLSFPPLWIQWIEVLYLVVQFNGVYSKVFRLQWLVRQDYPIALYLFLLIANVLSHML